MGSLGPNGSNGTVEEVHVQHCTFNGTDNGLRIKTYQVMIDAKRKTPTKKKKKNSIYCELSVNKSIIFVFFNILPGGLGIC